ncbi:copper fist DNA binding domain-containing protein [Radiomyces spectabilis]|uniref:copper fist DNA binding domain-containing protein n=1 Tax=Radiomyces spectabilis TaxID=64574 RepID=UPI00221F6734|nr:copper fist DNA binding domain-containing protein [Radiomyces spectabilis]KAI8394316.1 copper fist DNA binding domain-containing protein [Radiomyces spectabilis]
MAIERNGLKYACAACIRGHRVKSCQHHDRELVPLSKRGRQVSQCHHCRDLRAVNGTHVKCTCAIASAPNPINGCSCSIVHYCNCVATHLRDTQISRPKLSHNSKARSVPKSPSSDQGEQSDLLTFLTRDIDDLLSPQTIPLSAPPCQSPSFSSA